MPHPRLTRHLVAPLVAVTLLTSGCASRRQANIVAGTLGVTAGVAAISGVGLIAEGTCPHESRDCEGDGLAAPLGFFTLYVAAALAGSAAIVYLTAPDAPASAPNAER